MIKLIIVVAYVAFVSIATVARPEFLASNEFIDKISSYEILAVLGVILPISLASIVNIHFEISKIVARSYADNLQLGQAKAEIARSELNNSAVFLIGSFLAAIIGLIVKSEMLPNEFWRSATNGFILGTLLLMVMIMYDLHKTIFRLAASDVVVRSYLTPGGD